MYHMRDAPCAKAGLYTDLFWMQTKEFTYSNGKVIIGKKKPLLCVSYDH